MFLGRFGVVDLSGFKTEILRFRRNPMFQEKCDVSGEILCFKRNSTFQEKQRKTRVAKEDKSSKGRQE